VGVERPEGSMLGGGQYIIDLFPVKKKGQFFIVEICQAGFI
jgi:hypothetical protein